MADAPPLSAAHDLIATMAFDPMTGLADLEAVLLRLKAEAAQCGVEFDRHAVRNDLQAATFRLREPRQVRLLIGSRGAIAIEVTPAE